MLNLSEYFYSAEFKELIKPIYDRVKSSPKDSDNKYIDFKNAINHVTSSALTYYQFFMLNKENSQIAENNFHGFMQETVDAMCGIIKQSDSIVEVLTEYYMLNNPDVSWKTQSDLNRDVYINILKSACKYHAFNSAFEEGIRQHGINPNTKPFDEDEIISISNLLTSYGCPLSLGCSSRSKSRVYYSTTPTFSPGYGETSPEWFNLFCNGHLETKNHDAAKNHITSKCDAVKMSEEDKKIVLDFFEKHWNKFAINTIPKVAIIPSGVSDESIKQDLAFAEAEGGYNTELLWMSINNSTNAETDETIDVSQAEIVSMPEINELVRTFNREYRLQQASQQQNTNPTHTNGTAAGMSL